MFCRIRAKTRESSRKRSIKTAIFLEISGILRIGIDKLEFGEEDHIWKLLEDSKTCSGASKISTLQLTKLLSELLRADPEYLGSPSALSAKIDPDGTLGITPKKITRLVRESVAALRENGILADTYRSNGKRWISLKRAESADFLPVKTIGTIDPAGAPSACTAP